MATNQNFLFNIAHTANSGASSASCLGHPAGNSEYYYLNPHCCYHDRDTTRYAPLAGFGFGGYCHSGSNANKA